ncbi:hypothetical protein KIK84_00915 [Curvibacter sp. CHRR-16]|uniref:pectate lyase family protein n=1 Tax=Curvibacter sp. CHRR-16 TaxID=2835872 RepID=UPI001BDA3949|nr:hypothetical protein [Curvibacter sp. CHRR-16]MBT0568873.1 hypothetical protein [Curvibacter sp. CHRR-16]
MRALLVLGLLTGHSHAQTIGFGADTLGGKGGQVLRVTTLQSTGPGSLREALQTKGPRIIVFEVGGVIDLDRSDLQLKEPFVTIAGQTAPSPGITIIRGGMHISTHDVRMQHIRFRIGDAGQAAGSGFERDVSIEGANAYNVVVDHCSFAWGTDENLSVSGPRYDGPSGTAHRVTLSNNIVAEGLKNSTHSKGAHSMGTLVHDNVQDVAIIGNLYAHNWERNPWFKGNATGVVVNNVIYNPGIYAVRVGANPKEWDGRTLPTNARIAVVGNVMRHGADTRSKLALVRTNTDNGDVWMQDNLAWDRAGNAVPLTEGKITALSSAPVWPIGLTAIAASSTQAAVLRNAGARPRDRDAVDARLVSEVQSGTGHIPDSQDQVGGYPKPDSTSRALTIPADVQTWLQTLAQELEAP